MVTSQPLIDGLHLGQSMLDFGECYANISRRQLLVVRNISEDTLDVHFSSDLPDEVSFDLHTEYAAEGARGAGMQRAERPSASAEDDADGGVEDEKDEASGGEDDGMHKRGAREHKGERNRMRRIEEVRVAPGRERAVYVRYCPSAREGHLATRLTRRGLCVPHTTLEPSD